MSEENKTPAPNAQGPEEREPVTAEEKGQDAPDAAENAAAVKAEEEDLKRTVREAKARIDAEYKAAIAACREKAEAEKGEGAEGADGCKAAIAALKARCAAEKRKVELTTISETEKKKLEKNRECVASGDFTEFDDDAERRNDLRTHELKAIEDEGAEPDPDALLEVRHLKMFFPIAKTITGKVTQWLRAVDDVSFKLKAGETLGIVGESGCGKTTMGRSVLKLYRPTGGQIFFEGKDIAGYNSAKMRPLRTKMQIIFQDPYSSLPPRSTVGGILSEPVKVHKIVPPNETRNYVLGVMEQCGLRDYYFERYPHEFSGGQRQRICIARALSVKPKLVVCDEPVSALDVSIQAQIINLLRRLQQQMGLTYMFISHDLSVVKHISDRIGVMYLGSMVEFGDKKSIFSNPMHPYTQALFSAVPNPNPDVKMDRIVLTGDIPSPANPPKGCKFHTRCPKAMEICKHVVPRYREYEEGHFVACHCYPQEEE